MRFPARSTALRVGGAAVAMLVVAEAAVWLLAPRDEIPEPVAVSAGDYLDPAQIERAEAYRSGQRWLFFAGVGIEAAVLTSVALGYPRPVRRRLEPPARRPLLGAAAAGAGISLLTTIVTVPTRFASHERAVDV